ncbi:hypothetical protein SFMTTN_1350 [Sulfuriferula multivorans]|uniref:Carboxymuconolactone decarboxylase family protein n=1 Tax=Sulfuriferula multivorans TaxID=1559896 RepID=A0A401JDA9_9PROT|nr:hypothetical protein [Sulfuriferula multivorans]GBL45540.1 hypothetical protein SFMTTN_1350 [Sulfuriferula multivorans]
MPIIQTVASDQATGKVAEIYRQIEKAFGRVPNALQMSSSSPGMLEQQWQSIGYYMNHPTLGFPLLTMVRMLVSQENHCDYCVGFNAAMLINQCGLTPEQVALTKQNPAQAPLADKDKAMLLLVLKAVSTPEAVNAVDLQKLRDLGWSDGDILDAVSHGARNKAADIIFNAFKIENDF